VTRVLFAAPPGAEPDAAWDWLAACPDFTARRCDCAELTGGAGDCDVVWIHATAPVAGVDASRLAALVQEGKRVLLTLRATQLVLPMGLERNRPNDVIELEWKDAEDPYRTADFETMSAYPRVRGLAAYGPHPLFDGLHRGTCTWAPTEGERYVRCCYRRGARPAAGKVVAVERAYLAQNAVRTIAWEYPGAGGLVQCIGAHLYFAAPDRLLRPQLERLVRNALAGGDGPRTWWPEPATAAVSTENLALPPAWNLDGALMDPVADPIAMESPADSSAPFDLAGRRALLLGHESRGIQEVWVHPHRVIASWETAADGEALSGAGIRVSPDAVQRTLETSRRRVSEHCFVALEHPVVVLDYQVQRKGRESVGREAPLLSIDFTIDLRRMWPYSAGCGGNLRFRRSSDGRSLSVRNDSGDGVAAIYLSQPCDIQLRARYVQDVPVVGGRLATPLPVPLRVVIVGGSDPEDFDRTVRSLERLGVAGLVRQRAQRATTLREARLAVHCHDSRLPAAMEWAKRRLDAFLGDVPGVGRSLMAGYACAGHGWGAARPGYAWFLGRDACWSALALLALGEHSIPRQVLRFLGDTQDVTGKVIHEVTTSGQCHYDAADSTPLFLLLAGRYLQWTGDTAFLTAIWPKLERALRFCVQADTDGDGLMENTRIGHGVIESGPLAGAAVTLELAATWRAALESTARVAEAVGEPRVAADCWARAARAVQAIESDFWSEESGGYALDKRRDGSRTWARTALQSVAIVLGAANPVRARAYLDALAGNEFSAPWGVRLLPISDSHFNPDSRHGGSVWPLFTGWVALAEYRAGRADAGLGHLMANVALAFVRQRGAFDEMVHGLVDRHAGVCHDQACSAAMVPLPLVEGLLGAEPEAQAGRLALAPSLPRGWEWLDVTGLRCGESLLDVRLRRRGPGLEVRLRRTAGPPLWVTVAPLLDSLPDAVEVDGEDVRPHIAAFGGTVRQAVSLEVAGEHDVVYRGR
jgi:hypothetical protein